MSFLKLLQQSLVWIFWGIICLYSVAGFMPDPAIKVNKPSLNVVKLMLPQGWAFFTKDPKESYTLLFKIEAPKNEITEFTYKSASLKNSLGFSRSSRLVGGELGQLMSKIPSDCWNQEIGNIEKVKNLTPQTIIEQKLFFIPPGRYILTQQKPIPWAWYKRGQEMNQPFLYSVVEILEK